MLLEDSEIVMGLRGENGARAYPVRVLNYHEIVNDWLDGVPIAVTYCPLCGSGLVFRRDAPGGLTTFGVSGLLHDSDLILYDRMTKSLWAQATGRAFAGPRRGEALAEISVSVTTWGEWRAEFPDSWILQAPEPTQARYRIRSPYGNYDRSNRLMFPVSRRNRSLPPKEVVFGFDWNGGVAVSDRALRAHGCVRGSLGADTYEIRRASDGSVTLTGVSPAPVSRRMFWFAWYTFNPDTRLIDDRAAAVDVCPGSAATLLPSNSP